jgi:7-carboxy-7-deazaguanine synthase
VTQELAKSTVGRLIVTGGEPLMQQRALALLLAALPGTPFVEIETNGTLAPDPALAERVDQWNVSPKLSNGGDPEALRIRPAALAALLATERAFLKLVVGNAADVVEADALVAGTGWPRERVMLMPEAANRAELAARSGFVKEAALLRGLRSSPRLHVERWDGARGV